jgi:hypothetical protein
VVAGRRWLQDQAVDSREDEELANKGWHLVGSAMRIEGALTRRIATLVCFRARVDVWWAGRT